jgi:hypothetical protein
MKEGTLICACNEYLIYFPNIQQHNGNYKQSEALSDNQLCDIINLAKKPKWTLKMMEAYVDPYDLDLHDLLDYLEQLELVDSLTKKAQQSSQAVQKHQETSKPKPDGSKPHSGDYRAKKRHPHQYPFATNSMAANVVIRIKQMEMANIKVRQPNPLTGPSTSHCNNVPI